MTAPGVPVHLIGQVERDPEGRLWAVLYLGDNLISQEQVQSLRHGRRRITDMLLSAADTRSRRQALADPHPPARPRAESGPGGEESFGRGIEVTCWRSCKTGSPVYQYTGIPSDTG